MIKIQGKELQEVNSQASRGIATKQRSQFKCGAEAEFEFSVALPPQRPCGLLVSVTSNAVTKVLE